MYQSLCFSFGRMSFYAVARGRSVGIYKTWPECEAQVKGFAGAVFKKFKTSDEADQFILQKRNNSTASTFKPTPAALNKVTRTFNKRSTSDDASGSSQPSSKKSKIDETATTSHTSNIKQMKKYGKYNFLEDDDEFVHVYTDGSCENNGRSNAIAGYGVYFGEGHPLNTAGPVDGPATNNRGEIQACIKAIRLAISCDIKKLCIQSDSQFVIKAVTEWIKNWKKRGWRLSGGGSVKNEHDFRILDQLIEDNPQLLIRWVYVPGHAGIRINERADELAREGAKMYQKIVKND